MNQRGNNQPQRQRRPIRWRDVGIAVVLICSITTLTQWLRATPPLQELEWKVFARFYKARDSSRYADHIAIIAIDDAAYKHFETASPIPRAYLARLLVTLCEQAHPRAIGLDVLLDKPSPPGHEYEDAALEDALREARRKGVPVVLACDLPEDESPAYPLARFRQTADLGRVDVIEDPEIREVTWFRSQGKIIYPAFAAMLAARSAGVPPTQTADWVQNRLLPRGRYARYIYYASDATFTSYPSDEVLPENKPLLQSLHDRIVLIGATGLQSGDFHRTPLLLAQFPRGMPGVYVEAYELATLLAPGVLTPAPVADWLLCALAGSVCLALLYRLGAARAFLIGGVMILSSALAALLLFATRGYLVNVVPSLVAVFGCALIWWIRRARYMYACFDTFVTRPVHRGIGATNSLLDLSPVTGTSSVLFCDLIGFSKVCQRLSPEQTLTLANDYLAPVADIVEQWGGLLDKFLGDGGLAYFGAPLPGAKPPSPEESARQAVRAAWDIQQALCKVRSKVAAQGLPTLEMSFGIHTGPLSAGLVGSRRRLQFTVMGHTVNDACRVESIGHQTSVQPPLQTRLLVSAETAKLLEGRVRLEAKGYTPTEKYSGRVYEVLSVL